MSRRSLRTINNQRGVALVTVLFIGAALTGVTSVAAFTAIRDLRASSDERKGAVALAHAEAGIDRLLQYLRGGTVTWGNIRNAGCTVGGVYHPPLTFSGGPVPTPGANGGQGNVSGGSAVDFTVSLTVFNPFASGSGRFPPGACTSTSTSPRSTSPRTTQYFAITATGQAPAGTRVVRQVLQIKTLGLPIGVYADNIDANGTPSFGNCLQPDSNEGISLLSRFDVTGRSQMGFCANDPYYVKKDFWPALSGSEQVPSAIHTLGTIYTRTNLVGQEHPPALACTSNPKGAYIYQSQWDQSGKGGDISGTCGPGTGTPPPSSTISSADFEAAIPRPNLTEQDYQTLKRAAQANGIYCSIGGVGAYTCNRTGFNPLTGITTVPAGLSDNFIAYFEFQTPSTLDVQWNANYGRCVEPQNPSVPNQSVTMIVRNGNLFMGAGGTNRGAFLVPEGTYKQRGGGTIVGSVIAKNLDIIGGGTIRLDDCWVQNMPGPFLDYIPFHFSEVDR